MKDLASLIADDGTAPDFAGGTQPVAGNPPENLFGRDVPAADNVVLHDPYPTAAEGQLRFMGDRRAADGQSNAGSVASAPSECRCRAVRQ